MASSDAPMMALALVRVNDAVQGNDTARLEFPTNVAVTSVRLLRMHAALRAFADSTRVRAETSLSPDCLAASRRHANLVVRHVPIDFLAATT